MSQDFGSFIQELKDKIDITDVVSKYVHLENKGGRFWARCPFHNEKTASFTVHPEGQFYHCFGCNVSGDAIKFVQEMESLDFMDTVRLLCERYNIEMPKNFSHANSDDTARQKELKDRLLAAAKEAARYYYQSLKKHPAALNYLRGRGIDDKYITVFGLIFRRRTDKTPYPKGLFEQELVTAGIALKANGRLYVRRRAG